MSDNYRKNVGIVVFNREGKVLMCARADKPDMQWQFPQGGIEDGEDITAAAKRELAEETGITSVELVARMPKPLRYDFPPAIAAAQSRKGYDYKGQEQYWVLFYFSGDNSEIDFCTNPKEIEFKAYEWADIKEAPRRVVDFKKDVYNKVVKAFLPYIRKKNGRFWGLTPQLILQKVLEQKSRSKVFGRESRGR